MRRVLVIVLAFVAAGCGGSARGGPAAGPVKVVAAENVWGNIVAQLGGPRVRVTSILSDPSADPHLYESSPRDAAAVADASLVVENGAGYDDFMHDLAGAASKPVLTVAKVLGLRGNDVNPHIWYDIPKVRIAARAIVDRLSSIDPAHRDEFAQNLTAFGDALLPCVATIDSIKNKYPHTPVAYTERVPEYLLVDAGLDIVTPAGLARSVEDGTEPSAADQHKLNALIDHHAIKLLLYNAQATSRVTDAIRARARAANIPTVAVTETLPKNEPNYQLWQLHRLQAIRAGLGG